MHPRSDPNKETIEDILYKPVQKDSKPNRYVSIHHDRVKAKSEVKVCATMGVPCIKPNEPQNFLRKGTGVKRPSAEPQKRCLFDTTLPKLPPKLKVERNKDPKDFIKGNVKSAKGLKPKIENMYVVDSPDGHKCNVGDSNLKFVYNKHFATVPPYIVKRKNEIKSAEIKYRRELEHRQPLCTLINEEERQELLKGLKENLSQVQKSLILLPLMIDTVVKINKKKKIENTLKELEKSIALLKNHPYIYVYE